MSRIMTNSSTLFYTSPNTAELSGTEKQLEIRILVHFIYFAVQLKIYMLCSKVIDGSQELLLSVNKTHLYLHNPVHSHQFLSNSSEHWETSRSSFIRLVIHLNDRWWSHSDQTTRGFSVQTLKTDLLYKWCPLMKNGSLRVKQGAVFNQLSNEGIVIFKGQCYYCFIRSFILVFFLFTGWISVCALYRCVSHTEREF